MFIRFSGNEANSWLSGRMEARFLLQGHAHYRESMLYLIARNNLLHYTANTHFFSFQGDIRNYLDQLNSGNGPGNYTAKQLFLYSLTTLLNPLQWYAGWTIGKDYLLEGKARGGNIPMLGNKVKYLPSLDFNLTPFGAEFIMNNYFLKDNRLLNLQLRYGEPAFYRFFGLSASLYNGWQLKDFQLNGKLAMWSQPAFELGGSSIERVTAGWGGLAEVSGAYFPLKKPANLGLFARVGFKTTGYLQGESLHSGLILGVGLAWRAKE